MSTSKTRGAWLLAALVTFALLVSAAALLPRFASGDTPAAQAPAASDQDAAQAKDEPLAESPKAAQAKDATSEEAGKAAPEEAGPSSSEKAASRAADEAKVDTKAAAKAADDTKADAKTSAFEARKTIDGVTIAVQAPAGVFPEGATLSVSKVSAGDQKKVDAALDQARSDGANVAASYTFDIKVLDKAGAEAQPADQQKVAVSFTAGAVENANLDTRVYHIDDAAGIKASSVDSLNVKTESDTATVETESFSFYTVEFTYDSKEYVLGGNGSVALSEILDTLGLTGAVSAVEVSDDQLFAASNESGEWTVTAKKAFTSTEWMKVTIDGIVYEIVVTDAIGDVSRDISTDEWVKTGGWESTARMFCRLARIGILEPSILIKGLA